MNLPLEIVNKILVMRPRHPTAQCVKNMVDVKNRHWLEQCSYRHPCNFGPLLHSPFMWTLGRPKLWDSELRIYVWVPRPLHVDDDYSSVEKYYADVSPVGCVCGDCPDSDIDTDIHSDSDGEEN